MSTPFARDEREHSTDLAADRLAFLVVCYGALGLAAYRSFALGQESWDLLALVIIGGMAGLGYRLQRRVVSPSWAMMLIATITIAAVVAFAAAVFGPR